MDVTAQFKEKAINDYMSLIDLKNLSNLDYKKIETELSGALGEKPAVEFKYESDTKLNEDGKKVNSLKILECINIYYTIITNTGIEYKKMTFQIL
jgi:hypothetical protein